MLRKLDALSVADGECIVIPGPAHTYPRLDVMEKGKTYRMGAHRAAVERGGAPIPDGLIVCHRCDNRRCVRPEHLFVGTFHDNTQDMMSKGRHRAEQGDDHWARRRPDRVSRGVARPGALLTDDDVRAVVAMRTSGARLNEIGAKFGVSQASVLDICAGRTWTHITGGVPCAPVPMPVKYGDDLVRRVGAELARGTSATQVAALVGVPHHLVNDVKRGRRSPCS
jgi:hypothetical protein